MANKYRKALSTTNSSKKRKSITRTKMFNGLRNYRKKHILNHTSYIPKPMPV